MEKFLLHAKNEKWEREARIKRQEEPSVAAGVGIMEVKVHTNVQAVARKNCANILIQMGMQRSQIDIFFMLDFISTAKRK